MERAKLNALLAICETPGCRRQAILAHFGEAHAGHCGNCDTCLKPVETWDGTEAAIKALAAIYRTGERFGAGHLIDVLLGNENEKTSRFGHADMPVFGAGKDMPAKTWQSVYRQLLAAGLVSVDHEAFGALKLEPEARAVFKREREVRFRKDRPTNGQGVAEAPRQVPQAPSRAWKAPIWSCSRRCAPSAWQLPRSSPCRPMSSFRTRRWSPSPPSAR